MTHFFQLKRVVHWTCKKCDQIGNHINLLQAATVALQSEIKNVKPVDNPTPNNILSSGSDSQITNMLWLAKFDKERRSPRPTRSTLSNSEIVLKLIKKSYNFRKAYYPLMYQLVADIDCSYVLEHKNENDARYHLNSTLYSIIDFTVPLKVNRIRKYSSWFTSTII